MLKRFDGRQITFANPKREALYLKFLPMSGKPGFLTREQWLKRVTIELSVKEIDRLYRYHFPKL